MQHPENKPMTPADQAAFKKSLKDMALISKLRREIAENMYYEQVYAIKLKELEMSQQSKPKNYEEVKADMETLS